MFQDDNIEKTALLNVGAQAQVQLLQSLIELNFESFMEMFEDG